MAIAMSKKACFVLVAMVVLVVTFPGFPPTAFGDQKKIEMPKSNSTHANIDA